MRRLVLLVVLLAVFSALAYGQGGDPYAWRRVPSTFANLGTPPDGEMRYCSDCQATSPCTSGGTGAAAERVAGAWNCSTGGSGEPGGSNGQIQFNNAGAFSGLASTGTGDVARANSPTFVTPTLGAASATSIITTGATTTDIKLGGSTASFPAIGRTGAFLQIKLADNSAWAPVQSSDSYVTTNVRVNALGNFGFTNNSSNNPGAGGTLDTSMTRAAAGVVGFTNAIKIGSTTAKPPCDSTTRGYLYHFYGGAGVKDTVEVCAKDVGDAYAWRLLY